MENLDLTPGMQEMMTRMAQMQAELNDLKQRANRVTRPEPEPARPANPPAATSRRKALHKIGSGLVAASLGASLPLFSTSAASDQLAFDSKGPAGQSSNGVNLNAIPNAAGPTPLTLTRTFVGYDFRPVVSGGSYTFAPFGGIQLSSGDVRIGTNGFLCPLNLPQGAKVIGITFYFTDNDVSLNMGFNLFSLNPVDHTSTALVTLNSTGASAFPNSATATGTAASPLATIDNTQFSYMLSAAFDGPSSFLTLWGAKISYVNITGHFQAA